MLSAAGTVAGLFPIHRKPPKDLGSGLMKTVGEIGCCEGRGDLLHLGDPPPALCFRREGSTLVRIWKLRQ
jgi:hypothetical protein